MTQHSPLGASAAERWMKCPGSIQLLNKLNLPETEEEDYQRDGTCAHAALAECFEEGQDAWEQVGIEFDGVEFRADMSSAVQEMLDVCRADYVDGGLSWIERTMHRPEIHPLFMGTIDHGYLACDTLIVSDFKFGMGIPVDVEGNPQLLYYAFGLLQQPECKDVMNVKFRVVQPRAFHPDGHVREWECSVHDVLIWARTELLPAMQRTAESGALMPGDHCRFCPAKLACPAMRGLWATVAGRDASELHKIDDDTIAQDYALVAAVMHYKKALGEEVMRRLLQGHELSTAKLVDKKADRVFREGAEARLKAEFGDAIYAKPVMLSPPQIEKLGGAAKALVKEWAYTPKTGHTVAPMSDKRPAVKAEKTDWSNAITTLKDAAE